MNTDLFRVLPPALLLAAAAPLTAHARDTIGAYSYCQSEFKNNKAAVAACKACVGGGNMYNRDRQTKQWVCGLTSDMKKSEAAPAYKPPPKPKAMPATAKKYVTIPAGTFAIGMRENDEHGSKDQEFFEGATVTLTRPFLMKATEVTQGEWHFVMGEPAPTYDKECGPDCPVQSIGWRQAIAYLNELSESEGLEKCYKLGKLIEWTGGLDCKGYRLPTEAEWEFAARGGTKTSRYGELDDIAWYYDNSDGRPHPVGKKTPNAYGLYDMIGNAWEWTWDEYVPGKPFEGDMTDPVGGGFKQNKGVEENDNRVVRGASRRDGPIYQRATHRFQNLTDGGGETQAFRPVRTIVAK